METLSDSGENLVLRLEGFEGPMDLLLDLARAQKFDLAKISILSLVDQYLAVIEGAKRIRLELAADWLVMAAWLTWLKSRLLVPAAANDDLMQFQADLLGVPVRRPAVLETTALGAAYLAGLSSGFWSSIDELKLHRKADTIFEPKTDKEQMQKLQENWKDAVERSRHWNKESK